MRRTHMSTWDQEEYALGQRTPEMIQHLSQCAACRQGVEQLEQGVTLFRNSAMQWSAQCAETRLQATPASFAKVAKSKAMPALKWAMAAIFLLVVLVPLSRLLLHRQDSARVAPATHLKPVNAVPLADDALLQEVDAQVSEEVPDSMESLTHLVTTRSEAGSKSSSGAQHVERN